MKTTLICNYIFAGILFLSLNSIHAAPIDLATGYGDFKWGMSPDALFAAAQKTYGIKDVSRQKCQIEAYPEEQIVVTQDKIKTTFGFFQGCFYQVSREHSPRLSGYYTKDDIDFKRLTGFLLKELYSRQEGIEVVCSTGGIGGYGDRITGFNLTVTATNQSLYTEKIKELRSKSPDLNSILIDPLKKL